MKQSKKAQLAAQFQKARLAAEVDASQARLADAAIAVRLSDTQELRDAYKAAWSEFEHAARAFDKLVNG